MTLVVETANEGETRLLGARLGSVAAAGDVLLLAGVFGAGKTTLVQGFAAGLGVDDQVTSPSFVIANEYAGRLPLYHVDLYRLDQMDQASLEALDEYFGGDGVCIVEWPAPLPSDLTRGAARIELTVAGEHTRRLAMTDGPEKYRRVLRDWSVRPQR